jgi:KTSC domain
MRRITVSSSNLASVGYEQPSHTLEIAFHSGGIYRYSGVSEGVYQGLMAAGSKGQYFDQHIKHMYPFFRVR